LNDQIGIAHVTSGLSAPHRQYLAAGGKAFMLGDGKINYALEHLTEVYYKFALSEHLYLTGAYQLLTNPGYNKDRSGPVHIFSIRVNTRI
jgi:high affinity Mn2+ porin